MSLVSDRIEAASKEWWNTPRGLTLNRTELDWRAAMQSTERWLPVVGYEGRYEVSDHGRVRAPARGQAMPGGFTRMVKSRMIRPGAHPVDGYQQVSLFRDGSRRSFTVHHLVLTAFIGDRPDGMLCRHIDGNPANNVLDNLRWGTPSENMRDKRRHGTDHNVNKTTCPVGHPLSSENVEPSVARLGRRTCRACARAHGYARRHREAFRREVADLYFTYGNQANWPGDISKTTKTESTDREIRDDEADEEPDESLDDCAACDTPLSACGGRDAACCDDCTHSANWAPVRENGSER